MSAGEGLRLQPGCGPPRPAPILQVLRLPGHQLWARRRGDQQDDHQEVGDYIETLTHSNLVFYREEPIPEDKRESCANTELGPEVIEDILSKSKNRNLVGEEQLHNLLGLHIQHGKLWSQRDFKVTTINMLMLLC